MVDMSVIVPTYSVREPLRDCLLSLARQTVDRSRYEIIVVNNHSRAHARDFLEPLIAEIDPDIQLIQARQNQGYSGGCRLGAECAQGELLAFHNDDSIADPCWLALAWAEWKRTPDLGAVTCRIVDASGPRVQHEGVVRTLENALFWQIGYNREDRPEFQEPVHRSKSPDPPQSPDPMRGTPLEYLTGCIWATPREVWDDLGGLSAAYSPGYYEDTEYCLRARQRGYRLSLLPHVTCGHFGSLTLTYGSPRYWRVFHRSRYLYLLRNLQEVSLWEVARKEFWWWRNQPRAVKKGACLWALMAVLPLAPSALFERSSWRKNLVKRQFS
jgi:GT2 family glycosyltransferase